MFATTVFAAGMRCSRVRAVVLSDPRRRRTTSIRRIPASAVCPRTHVASSVVPASVPAAEAMFAPAMAVAPVRPWAHAQEDAVIEISRPVKAARRAAIRCRVVVAVGTDRRIYAYAYTHGDLRGCWHDDQGREQGCCTGQKQTAHGGFMCPARHVLELPHFVVLQIFCWRAKGMFPVSGSGAVIAGQYRPFSAAVLREWRRLREINDVSCLRMNEIERKISGRAQRYSGGHSYGNILPPSSGVTLTPRSSAARAITGSRPAARSAALGRTTSSGVTSVCSRLFPSDITR